MRLRSLKKLRNINKNKANSLTGGLSSKSEKFFLDIIELIYSIKIERQYYLNYRFYDGKFENHLFEIDGERWHSRKKDKKRDELKEEIAKKCGLILHRIKLNRISEVPTVLEEHRDLLNKIFKKND